MDDALPAKKEIKITADSRYKLYINGKFVQEGPQKPLDQKEWFVDTANAAPYLVPGANVVTIPPACTLRTAWLITLPLPGKNGWKCTINREIAIIGETGGPAPIHAQENVYATEFFAGWKLPGCST